jgi:VanZ family protein
MDHDLDRRMKASPWWRYWAPPAAYFALIFALSSFSSLPEPPGISLNILHYPEYAVMAFLLARAIHGGAPGRSGPGTYALSFVLTAVAGAVDEIHQAFVPGRLSDVNDFIHDVAGGVAGLLLWAIWRELDVGWSKRRGGKPCP